VLLGWLADLPTLVHVLPSHVATEPNAAACLLLCGAGLLAFAVGRARLATALAAVAGAIGVLTLAEYVAGIDLGIDALVARGEPDPHATAATTYAGRMAPQAAVGFVIAATALVLASGSRAARWRMRPAAVALLGAAALAIGAVALGVHAFGLAHAGGWGGACVALPTSLGLVTLAAGILAAPIPGSDATVAKPRTVAAAVGTLSAFLLLSQALSAKEREATGAHLSERAHALARYVESRMASAVQSVEGLAVHEATYEKADEAVREAEEFLRQVQGFRGVARVDASGQIAWIVTTDDVGVDASAVEQLLPTTARDARVVRVPGTDTLLVAVPASSGEAPGRRLVGLASLATLLANPVVDALADGADVALEEGADRVLSLGTRAHADPDRSAPAGASTLQPRGSPRPWGVVVRPAVGSGGRPVPLPTVVLLGGSVLGALLAMSLHLADRARARAAEAERAGANLLLEVEYRHRLEEERDNFFSISPDLLCVADAEGRFLHLNDAWRKTLGLGLEEIHARPAIELVHPEDRAAAVRAAVGLRRGRPVSSLEVRCRASDGTYRWLQWSAAGSPERGRVYAIARDVTDQRLVAEALKDREAQFRAVAETANDAIVCSDRRGRISYFNRSAERIFQRSADHVAGEPIDLLVPEHVVSTYAAILASYLTARGGRILGRTVELVGRRRDGSEFPLEVSLAGWNTESGPFFAGILRDVTERKRAEAELRRSADELARSAAELRRSNEELQHFAYVASHDLQEPLRMVASYTDLLANRYRGRLDADADEFIGYAVDGARRMQQLIQDLLEFARVGTRGRPFAPVPSRRALDRACLNLRARIEETGAEVVVQDLPVLVADEGQLVQLFQNLLGNALKFRGKEPPRVVVSSRRGDCEWVVAVADNGIGIAPEHFQRVFQVFQRLHGRDEYPGTGIGLAICKRIVDRHGGRIWIESEVGKGATFLFSIPDREATSPPP
jgi:PAS domain S-box-containing protein